MENTMNIEIQQGDIIRHYKGNYYEVLSIGKHTETLEDMVTYKAMYLKDGEFKTWIRPLSMFYDIIDNEQYKKQTRFTKLDFPSGQKNVIKTLVYYCTPRDMTETEFQNGIYNIIILDPTKYKDSENIIKDLVKIFNPKYNKR